VSKTIKVVVVDDHPLFRAGVVQAIELDKSIQVVAQGSSANNAVELSKKFQPDVILLDISLPDANGIQAAATLSVSEHSPQILMLTVSADVKDVMQSLDVGAAGYVLKGVNAADLIHAVKTVASGQSFISPTLSFNLLTALRRTAEPNPVALLTPQEERILRLVSTGLSNREIGDRLRIHEKTVKYHVTNLFKKLNVRNRVEASRVLTKLGQAV
jgi:Response regulator containing a CheY-like receiver domain and an HTH DNA-binding domain